MWDHNISYYICFACSTFFNNLLLSPLCFTSRNALLIIYLHILIYLAVLSMRICLAGLQLYRAKLIKGPSCWALKSVAALAQRLFLWAAYRQWLSKQGYSVQKAHSSKTQDSYDRQPDQGLSSDLTEASLTCTCLWELLLTFPASLFHLESDLFHQLMTFPNFSCSISIIFHRCFL